MSAKLPTAGTRLALAGHYGTIRFAGPVEGTRGEWLGVEWDDPARGKHSGVHGGKAYFSCSVPGSGSFIRPPAPSTVTYGTSFLAALSARYIDEPTGEEFEQVFLGDSEIPVEVLLNKSRKKLAKLDTLKEVSIEEVCSAEEEGRVRSTCPNIRGLDLSASLIPSWAVLCRITSELPHLQRLYLNRTRLAPLPPPLIPPPFASLAELTLNATCISWSLAVRLARKDYTPCLRILEVGENRYDVVESDEDETELLNLGSSVSELSLASNKLQDFRRVLDAMRYFPSLSRLLLLGNPIASIEPAPLSTGTAINNGARDIASNIRHLSLAHTQIHSFESLDHLRDWMPNLTSLALAETPLGFATSAQTEAPVASGAPSSATPSNRAIIAANAANSLIRVEAIARIASLEILDGATISSRERVEAERFWLLRAKEGESRWDVLCEKHGRPDRPTEAVRERMADKLIRLHIRRATSSPPTVSDGDAAATSDWSVSVLPTAPLRAVRRKIARAISSSTAASQPDSGTGAEPTRSKAPKTVELWMRMRDGGYARVGEEGSADDSKEIDWWGVEQDSIIYVFPNV